MSKVRVGFNGMGRIGKNVMRVIVSKLNDRFEIVAGNDLVPAADIAASLPKDAVYGRFPAAVEQTAANKIRVGDHELTIYAEMDAANVPWGDHGVDIVFECTGFYLTTEKASAHLKGGARRSSSPRPATTPPTPWWWASTTTSCRRSTRSSPTRVAPPTAWRR